jgi:hypothetical protein
LRKRPLLLSVAVEAEILQCECEYTRLLEPVRPVVLFVGLHQLSSPKIRRRKPSHLLYTHAVDPNIPSTEQSRDSNSLSECLGHVIDRYSGVQSRRRVLIQLDEVTFPPAMAQRYVYATHCFIGCSYQPHGLIATTVINSQVQEPCRVPGWMITVQVAAHMRFEALVNPCHRSGP